MLAALSLGIGYLQTARTQAVVQDVDALRQAAARWLERGRVDYTALSVSALRTEGQLPSGWSAQNPYGGSYTVGPAAGDPTRLTVAVSGLPDPAGTTLVTYYTGRVHGASFTAGTLAVEF